MAKTRMILVGAGGMARYHLTSILQQLRTTTVTALVEPAIPAREAARGVFAKHNADCPPAFSSIRECLGAGVAADAALIVTPHKFHLPNTLDCLRAGLDVLLEKPMVLNAREARKLIEARDQTGRLVVVAFPGSLSPAVAKARAMIAGGQLGRVTAISGFVHQGWKKGSAGTWRQNPAVSGGGFLFDTGSHLINTMADLAGADVAEVSATLDNDGAPVEILAAASGRFKNGIVFSFTGAGDSIRCSSQITFFGDKGILQIGMWGEYLRFNKPNSQEYLPVPLPKSLGVWEQFLKVRAGRMKNPCPPEIGLRFALLMDMIHRSAKTGRTAKAA